MALLKSWSSKLHSTHNSALYLELSQIVIIMSSGSIVFEFGNFWHKLADQSSLKDQDKQQIGFFVIRFTVRYSDRLVATASIKVLDFLCHAKGCGICPPVTPAL